MRTTRPDTPDKPMVSPAEKAQRWVFAVQRLDERLGTCTPVRTLQTIYDLIFRELDIPFDKPDPT